MSAINTITVKPEQAVYTLVVGLGVTGLSVVRYLRALGEAVVVVDSREVPPALDILKAEYSDVEYHTGKFNKALFVNAHRIVVSPGVSLTEPALLAAKRNAIEITGDIDLFTHEVGASVIGITGSNGKSTVTTLLTLMASKAGVEAVACGNIGMPVLDALSDDVALYVLELSSFQLESLQFLPMKAAVVLNVSADHLDRYPSVSAYAASKQLIYANAETLVFNKDDVLASAAVVATAKASTEKSAEKRTENSTEKGAEKNIIGFTLSLPEDNEFGLTLATDETVMLSFGKRLLIAADQLKVKGEHNVQNALAALALGQAIGLPMDSMLATLQEFSGLPHRSQFVAQINGVNWINDSKATNVGATVAALTGLAGKHVLIAGGVAKDADFSLLAEVISQHCRAVVLMGEDAKKISAVIPEPVTVKFVTDMQSAVLVAQSLAETGDNVLLAPACASFDMFDDFEHRGAVFMQQVERLISEVSN